MPRRDLDALLLDAARGAEAKALEGFKVNDIHHDGTKDTKDTKNHKTRIER